MELLVTTLPGRLQMRERLEAICGVHAKNLLPYLSTWADRVVSVEEIVSMVRIVIYRCYGEKPETLSDDERRNLASQIVDALIHNAIVAQKARFRLGLGVK